MTGRALSVAWKRYLQETRRRRRTLWGCEILPPSSSSIRNAAYHLGITTEGPTKLDYETQVLSFGDGSNGALGHDAGGYLSDVFEPVAVQGLPKNIVKVAAGHYHSLAVTDDGEVWAWGRNAEGQLGRRERDSREDWCRPRRVEGLENMQIKDVAGSGVVSLAIAYDGSLWSWGSSKRGQLGLSPNLVQSLLPRKVETLSGYQMSQVLR